jgi:hypothetical protein
MSDDDKNRDGAPESVVAQPFSRRKMLYAAPAILTRKMFYSHGLCGKQGTQGGECVGLPNAS